MDNEFAKYDCEERLKAILARDDAMGLGDAERIADAVAGDEGAAIVDQFLEDLILCDGNNNESKLAAIVRGMLLVQRNYIPGREG